MAINYTIQAKVIDIASDNPKPEDVFLVDTNVWFWMTYSNATFAGDMPPQSSDYSKFVNAALNANSKIFHSGLSLAELAHLIERTERKIYTQSVAAITPKEYRHNLPSERARVVAEVQAAWSQAINLSAPLDTTIDVLTTTAALDRIKTEKLDGYDLFFLESIKNNGVAQIITDDGDFTSVPDIQVFTSNRNIIFAARTQGKLLKR